MKGIELNAHGCGTWHGFKCTNCLEALNAALRNGFKYIELDISITSDGVFVVGQDDAAIRRQTEKEFLTDYALGGGTRMNLDQLLSCLAGSSGVRVMLDYHPGFWFDCPDELTQLAQKLGASPSSNMFWIEAYSIPDAKSIFDAGFGNVILWLGNRGRRHTPLAPLVAEKVQFCLDSGVRAVSVSQNVLAKASESISRLKTNGIEVFSPGWNALRDLREAKKLGVDVATTDDLVPGGWIGNKISVTSKQAAMLVRRVKNAMRRRLGMTKTRCGRRVFLVGVFDLLHYGHFELFRRAKALAEGGRLIVAIQDDDYVLKYKPEANIVMPLRRRIEMVQALRWVDQVEIYTDVDEIVREVDFDVFVVGGDQKHAGFMRAIEWCRANGREVVRLARTPGISSTELRRGTEV